MFSVDRNLLQRQITNEHNSIVYESKADHVISPLNRQVNQIDTKDEQSNVHYKSNHNQAGEPSTAQYDNSYYAVVSRTKIYKNLMKPLDTEYTVRDIVKLGLLLCPLWFFSNLLYNYSLLLTSISSSTIIRYY
jgi:hypothetical protein